MENWLKIIVVIWMFFSGVTDDNVPPTSIYLYFTISSYFFFLSFVTYFLVSLIHLCSFTAKHYNIHYNSHYLTNNCLFNTKISCTSIWFLKKIRAFFLQSKAITFPDFVNSQLVVFLKLSINWQRFSLSNSLFSLTKLTSKSNAALIISI